MIAEMCAPLGKVRVMAFPVKGKLIVVLDAEPTDPYVGENNLPELQRLGKSLDPIIDNPPPFIKVVDEDGRMVGCHGNANTLPPPKKGEMKFHPTHGNI